MEISVHDTKKITIKPTCKLGTGGLIFYTRKIIIETLTPGGRRQEETITLFSDDPKNLTISKPKKKGG